MLTGGALALREAAQEPAQLGILAARVVAGVSGGTESLRDAMLALSEVHSGELWRQGGYPGMVQWAEAELSTLRAAVISRGGAAIMAGAYLAAIDDGLRLPEPRIFAIALGLRPKTLSNQLSEQRAEVRLTRRAERYTKGEMGPGERFRLETVAALDRQRQAAGLELLTQQQVAAAVDYSQSSVQQDRAFLARYGHLVAAPQVVAPQPAAPAPTHRSALAAPDAGSRVDDKLAAARRSLEVMGVELRALLAVADDDDSWRVPGYQADLAQVTADGLVAQVVNLAGVLTSLGVDVPATLQAGEPVWADDYEPRLEVGRWRLVLAWSQAGATPAQIAQRLRVDEAFVQAELAKALQLPLSRRMPTYGVIPRPDLVSSFERGEWA